MKSPKLKDTAYTYKCEPIGDKTIIRLKIDGKSFQDSCEKSMNVLERYVKNGDKMKPKKPTKSEIIYCIDENMDRFNRETCDILLYLKRKYPKEEQIDMLIWKSCLIVKEHRKLRDLTLCKDETRIKVRVKKKDK